MKLPLLTLLLVATAGILLTGCDALDPEQIRARNFLPAVDYRPSVVQGETQYQQICARCHGVNLYGSSEGPPLLDRVYAPSHHADLAFYHAVKNGVRQHHWKFGDMPMLTGITPEQTSDIVAFVRTRQQSVGID